MAELKSHEVDAALRRGLPSQKLYLIYGPDRGLVSERARRIAELSGVPLDDPFSVVRLDGSDLQANPGRLMEEVSSFGLFGGEKLVWVRGSGTEKALIDELGALTKMPASPTIVVVEAGDLKKGTGLRKIAETSGAVLAMPCYADDARAVQALIDGEISHAGLKITAEARERLAESLGGDRIASRNELRKLALYAQGQDMIDEEDVTAIIGDASAVSVDDAVDAVLKGDVDGLDAALRKIAASKTPLFLVLQGCLRQFQQMDVMLAEMDDKRLPPGQVIATLGRGLHFRRKPLVEAALKHWSGPLLRRESDRLQNAILQTRGRAVLEEQIAMHALLAVTVAGRRR
ncbi:DNA polymerase III subunit delta [Xaviernesmea oryzae]|uniref:DNA polymerase III subunit delta n=1 Tax=Xaviernesmea oryzae TaxID=464029 RepID=A0A1Q9AY77_9HYPH|nr:DNA polymerase III subunit delta [Xaviernesmea oryzae]OLP60397.1 DNA polymerase III subunit delta [Xaviernesmea oryzae]SEK20070.1 DNA polymerase III, delta subunit [Xaviernesmea oryzae]